MYKILNPVKFILKALGENFFIYAISFLLFPIGLAFLYGTLYGGDFSEEMKGYKIAVVDMAKTDSSENFSKAVKNLGENFEITDEENADYVIEIPEDYDKGEDIIISGNKNSSNFVGLGLAEAISNMSDSIRESEELSEKIAEKSNDTDFLNQFSKVSKALNDNPIKIEAKNEGMSEKKINENVAIDFLAIVVMMYLISIPKSNKKLKEIGVNKREAILPLKNFERFLGDWLSNAVFMLIMMILYVIIMRIAGRAFTEFLPLIILSLIIASLFYGLIAVIVSRLPFETLLTAILMVLYMGQVLMANMVDPEKGSIFDTLKRYSIGSFIAEPLKNIANFGSLNGMGNFFIITVIISLIFIAINMLILRKRGGRI